VLGSRFLEDIATFFTLFQTMEQGFVARSREVEALLVDPRTTFAVVTTLEASPVAETRFFIDELGRRRLELGAVILNRTLPPAFRDRKAANAAKALAERVGDAEFVSALAATAGTDDRLTAGVLAEVAERFHDVAVVGKREAERRRELADAAPLLAEAPLQGSDVRDLAGLLALGNHVWR
jgi:anion-transporting  ArsA/GET3 family ATPase